MKLHSRVSILAIAGAAMAATASAQGDFPFDIDSSQTTFTWGGTTSIGDIDALPPTFTLIGTTELNLTSGGSPIGTGSFTGTGDALVSPDLHGEIPNPIPIFPPLAVIDVVGMHFVLSSPAYTVDGAGQFTTDMTGTAIAGTMIFDPIVGDTVFVELAGLSSSPATSTGSIQGGAGQLQLSIPVDISFDFLDPGSGVSGTVWITGTAIADFACPTPTNYCTSSPNSVGAGSIIGSSGSTSIFSNDLVLTADGLPNNQFGIFYYGPNQTQLPFGNGVRCVSGQVVRLTPINPGQTGFVSFPFDHKQTPNPGQIEAGNTRNFQFWYRDPAAGGAGFNFSDATEVFFCP